MILPGVKTALVSSPGNGTKLQLSTRKMREIDNWMCRDALPFGLKLQCDNYKRDFQNAVHRPSGACNGYNCHGLTFASRRSRITESAEVQKILEDDGYDTVSPAKVMAGDVIIYRADALEGGEIEHSGIVVLPPAGSGGLTGIPYILSKWGSCHEVLHFANDSPYNGKLISYHRIRPLCA